jgi:hypothetical protein
MSARTDALIHMEVPLRLLQMLLVFSRLHLVSGALQDTACDLSVSDIAVEDLI